MKKTKSVFFLFCAFCLSTPLKAQNCCVRGKIIDGLSKAPISYASVVILKDSVQLQGAMTDNQGAYEFKHLKTGNYRIKISFIGYQSVILDPLLLQPGVRDLGKTTLLVLTENLQEITVQSSRPPLTYKVDRKVIDAGSFPGAEVAMDLLENLPSIQLDFEGKLTYRGDGTFKVYVNGHPVANGEEKLKQLPASQIDKIEVITNPSAKYDAEGTAGIIQVILKKNRLEGYAINTSAKGTSQGAHEWLFSVDHKGEKSGWYIQGNRGKDIRNKYDSRENQVIYSNGLTYQISTNKSTKKSEDKSYLEIGFNYDLTAKDYIDFSGYIYPEKSKQSTDENGEATEQVTDEGGGLLESSYLLNSDAYFNYRYIGSTLTYEHAFNKKRTHLLSAYLDYSGYLQDLDQKQIDTRVYDTYTERAGNRGIEHDEVILEGKLSYSVPLTEKLTLETGLQINTDHIPRITSENGNFDEKEVFKRFAGEDENQSVNFIQDVYAGYVSLKREAKKLSVQLGMRMEHTKRRSDYSYTGNEDEKIILPDRTSFTDFFPSAHFTYSLSKSHQIYLSYSRRIRRPNYWSLVPLQQYTGPYSYYQGNGDLKPAFSNSWEAGYKKSWDKNFISFEAFVRQTNRFIQNYYRTKTEDILIFSPENVGKSFSTGGEFMTGVNLFPWWNLNLSSNLYAYKLNIDFETTEKTSHQLKTNTRLNNTFLLPESFTLKWDLDYKSPIENSQMKRDGYFVSNLAIKKSFAKGKWVTTFVYNNLFTGNKYDQTTEGTDFHIKTSYTENPFVSFKVAYILDNQK